MPTLITQPHRRKPASAEDLLETGLPGLWYLIARSEDVADRPVGLKRLDRNLVLWRDGAGALRSVEDYCPHRGAPLSMGQVIGDDVVCPYHGVAVNGAGIVTAVPPTPDCQLVGRKFLRCYETREMGGAIWAYFGEDDGTPAPDPVFPTEVSSPAWSSFLFTTVWNCNWQVALDNRLDPIHGSFLHEGTFTLGRGRKDAELQVVETLTGFETTRSNQRGVNIDWHEAEFHRDNIIWVRTEIPYPEAFGGGCFRINGFPTPIDRHSTLVWFFRSREVSGWERNMWRFLYRNRLEARAFEVVDQDRVLLEAIPLEARSRERLIQTDIAVSRMRRYLMAEAQRHFEALSGP